METYEMYFQDVRNGGSLKFVPKEFQTLELCCVAVRKSGYKELEFIKEEGNKEIVRNMLMS